MNYRVSVSVFSASKQDASTLQDKDISVQEEMPPKKGKPKGKKAQSEPKVDVDEEIEVEIHPTLQAPQQEAC